MMEIQLTRGLVALIDSEDFDLVAPYVWHAHQSSYSQQKFYARASVWVGAQRVKVRMHRLIMAATADQMIDHANGDTLDNRRCNLRFCDRTLNNANANFPLGNIGFRGVAKVKSGRFRAAITVRGQCFVLGRFDSPEAAAAAYDEAARRAFGPFARLNFAEVRNAA